MSVRHVYAKKGQYIKVHRNYGGGQEDSGNIIISIIQIIGAAIIILIVGYIICQLLPLLAFGLLGLPILYAMGHKSR